jgi:predicted Fe-Mo cluster-binding NifX family protein
MLISIATEGSKVCPHFGHAEIFTMVTVENGQISNIEKKESPGHAPGALPLWMKENKVDLVIAAGMGPKAQEHFCEHGIDTLIVESMEIEEALSSYLAGTITPSKGECHHTDE